MSYPPRQGPPAWQPPPPRNVPGRRKWKTAGIGCGGLVAAVLLLGVIGAIADPAKKPAASSSSPVAAVTVARTTPVPTVAATTPSAAPTTSTPASSTPTPKARVTSTAKPQPKATPKPKPKPAKAKLKPTSAGGVGVIKSPSGNFYRAGEFCPNADAGLKTLDANGNTLTCVYESGRYHWHR